MRLRSPVELQSGVGHLLRHPVGSVAGLGGCPRFDGVHPRLLQRVGECLREASSPTREHQIGGGQRVGEICHQRAHIFNAEPADTAGHHHSPLGEKGRGEGRIGHRAEVVVGAVELVDHERPVFIAHQVMHEFEYPARQERLVVAGYQMHAHTDVIVPQMRGVWPNPFADPATPPAPTRLPTARSSTPLPPPRAVRSGPPGRLLQPPSACPPWREA